MRRISLFPKWDEFFHLLLPFLMVIAAVAAALGGLRLSMSEVRAANFLANVIFLNLTHTGFTFVMLFCLPEVRAWISERTEGKPLLLWGHWAIAFALIGFFFLRGQSLLVEALGSRTGEQLILWALVGWASYHSVIQSYGISRLYDRALMQNEDLYEDEKKASILGAKRCGWLFFALIAASLSYSLMHGVDQLRLPSSVSNTLIGIEIGIVTLILVNSLMGPRGRSSNQSVFLSRLYLVPLAQVTSLGFYFLMAMHGIEYFYVFKRMATLSQARNDRRAWNWTIITTLVIATAVIAFALARREVLRWALIDWFPGHLDVLVTMGLISRAISFSHYYVDGFLFRMANPSNRRLILPLLVPAGGAERSAQVSELPMNPVRTMPS